ncbi:MAG: tRNA (adenosine(37)-N6)-threonylcarbamoyltransferase complex dimerization subunit type 1 TsaB [Leptolyngbyaceae cyanobacterium SL_5_9]|nr:tRNA (adenosine(37)-N6)-threonylcarbamoyltransferase complex dimerization subunit type 1 TsaB [bacterium]NJN56468.1 tRNA (adenosine(37)-N6)-threonylcarbamoyltransferase complex dimerization subunit type 1 TsaB [Leptolyngbyaceae cyanobacterium SL_5_9]
MSSSDCGLAIHTSSSDLGLALSNFAGEVRSQHWDLGRSLSSHLHQYLMEFIQPQTWEDFRYIAVAKGPGGFTGTRMGVVAARTLAQQLNLPLFGISSLAAVAWSGRSQAIYKDAASPMALTEQANGADIAVQMRAQRGELFVAVYGISQAGPVELLVDSVMDEKQWQQALQTWPRRYHLIQAEGGLGMTAASLLELARLVWQQGLRPDWSTVLPFYGQHPVSV